MKNIVLNEIFRSCILKVKLNKLPFLLLFLNTILYSSCNKSPVCENLAPENQADNTGCKAGMDVLFLIDYTGSMGNVIDDIKVSVSSIVNNIEQKSQGDYQIALGIFDEDLKSQQPLYVSQPVYTSLPASNKIIVSTGLFTNQYLTIMQKFAPVNKIAFSGQLNKLNTIDMLMGSGNGMAEPGGLLAYECVNNDFAGLWRSGKEKFCFIITDAPDGGDDDQDDATDDIFLQNLAQIANQKKIRFILITNFISSINYKVHLIDNNINSYWLVNSSFANVSGDINAIINKLCE